MGKRRQRWRYAVRGRELTKDDPTELALLAEFIAHDSVASLAQAIARRVRREAREEELKASALSQPRE